MKRAIFVGLVVLAAACGGKIEETGDGTTSTSGGSGTSGGSPGATGTTTSVPPSPPSPGPTKTPGDPGTPPTPSSTKAFTAQAQLGGLDRIFVFAADKVADSCIRLQLISPSMKSRYDVATPDSWSLIEVTRSPGAARCGGGKQPPSAESATDAVGAITFTKTAKTFPCALSVHASVTFNGKPAFEKLDGDNIAVEGCQ